MHRRNWVRLSFFAVAAFVWVFSSTALAAEKPLRIKLSVAGGYDDNANLNSFRKGDGFAQESASLLYRRLLHKKTQMRLSYSGLNVNYMEATDQNIFSNQVGGGIDVLLSPRTIWENDYTFQYLDFTRSESSTSYANGYRIGIRQKITPVLNGKAGFTINGRQYVHKKTRLASGLLAADDERSDIRYTADYQLNWKALPAVIVTGGGSYLWNESDDLYQDYYDFEACRVFAGFSWQISKQWSSSMRVNYEWRSYDSRALTEETAKFQSDDLFTVNASLYYAINPQLSLGSTYTYREKWSNEPSQEYSGSLGTLGLYHSF